MLTPQEMADIARACWPKAHDVWTPNMIKAQLDTGQTTAICRENGFAMLRVAGPEAEILSIDVLPDARRGGIGSDLLAEALEIAKDKGVEQVFLEVDVENTPAIRLYEKFGFSAQGKRAAYYRKADGNYADALVMARFFGTD